MKISKLLENMGISEDNQKSLEEAIGALIEERVSIKEEELKTKLETVSEEYVQEELGKKEAELTEKLNEEAENYKQEWESEMIDKIDRFLDEEICKNISDTLLEKVAINEVAMPIVESIKKVYEENYVQLDSDGDKVIKEAKEEVETLKEQNANLINEKLELSKTAEKAAVKLYISEAVEGLTEAQKNKVINLFEDKSFDEVESKVSDYIDMLIDEDAKAGKDPLEESTANGKGESEVEDSTFETETPKPVDPIFKAASRFM